MRPIEWLALAGLALLWGMSFMFMELAIPSFATFTLVLIRVGVAALLMLLLVRHRQPWRFLRERWRVYAVIGFFGSAFPFLCFAWGQRHIDSGTASVLNALTPLFALLIALANGREQFSGLRAAGLVVGFLGVAALMDAEASAAEWEGIGAGAIAALCYAIAANYAWTRAAAYPARENACGQLVFATLFLLPFALAELPAAPMPTWTGTAAVLGLAVLSTYLAFILYYYLISAAGGVNATLVTLLIPFVAVALGIVFLGERFGSEFFVGGALILSGVVLSDAKLRAQLRRLAGWRR